MAGIIKTSINLSMIPKDKIIVEQTKDERDAKAGKTYLGNVKVVWTNGNNVDAAPRDNSTAPPQQAQVADNDLPF